MTTTTCLASFPNNDPEAATASWKGPDARRLADLAGNLALLDAADLDRVEALVRDALDDDSPAPESDAGFRPVDII